MKTINRIMIAGTGSGCGKTTITCGILQGLIGLGYQVGAFKCGPDYIDPMFHSKVLGAKTGNLDSFFTEPRVLRELLYVNSKELDITVMEGVMGYYDGIGFSDTASSYSIAKITDTPVILILNCKGMSNSIGAMLKGYLGYRENSRIKGVIFNQLPESLYEGVKLLANEAGIKALGYVPKLNECTIESRHLGLVTANEIHDIKSKIEHIANVLLKTVDFKEIMEIARNASQLEIDEDKETQQIEFNKEPCFNLNKVNIAIAQDEAFCFHYRENLNLLKQLGCKLIPFSPMRDRVLPRDVDGIILVGGYPELYTKVLSENHTMITSIKTAIEHGIPTIAECGGFLYLHEFLDEYPMVGVIKGKAYKTNGLKRFGYIYLEAKKDNLLLKQGERIQSHEFHYFESENPGNDFLGMKASNKKEWDCGYGTDNLYAGFPHLYLYQNNPMAERFVHKCKEWKHNGFKGVQYGF